MFKILPLVAAMCSVLAAGAVRAAVLVIDDFGQPDAQVAACDCVAGGGFTTLFSHALTGQLATSRVVEQNLLANGAALSNPTLVTVGGGASGFLGITNDRSDSDVRLNWQIDRFTQPVGDVTLVFDVLSSKPAPLSDVTIAIEFRDGSDVLQWQRNVLLDELTNTSVTRRLFAGEVADLAAGGRLQAVITGITGWSLQLDAIKLTTPDPDTVPEPASLALAALALAGAGAFRRRAA